MMTLRDLHSIPEYQHVVELERRIWGYTDDADVITVPVFIITIKRGAILIGAFDDDRMIGFVYSLVGVKNGKAMQWSHMAGVLPEYRAKGLGRELKLAQRERALAGGFDLIEWTFDPLQAVNAHLNFAKLGVVADEYAVNIYGDSSSALHRGTPTDRLVVQWNIGEPHVARRVERRDSTLVVRSADAGQAPTVNRTRQAGVWRVNDAVDLSIAERRVWVEIPIGFTEMQQQAPDMAIEWRLQTREIFQTYFARRYRAVDFELQQEHSRGRYLLATAVVA
jgi:predicted GNAT superfamily acetyltransferase